MTNYFTLHNEIESEYVYGSKARSGVDLTIVIPTYKRIDLLKKTLCSIVSQKVPKRIKYQVIVVSNDPEFNCNSLDMVLSKEIFSIYRNKQNLGMVGNMNRCAMLAQGEYIAYIQDDDVLLENYIVEFEKLYDEGYLEHIDCLIPNRYYYYEINNEGIFGKKAYESEKKKMLLKKILSVGVKKTMFQKITPIDCAMTWYNCYSGGPTCGVVFKRKSLMCTYGFSEEYPYVFDYVFFINFSKKNNVYLYDKYLSIYRMADSASNISKVQVDFFRGDMYLLEKTKSVCKFVKSYENEIIKFSKENKSVETQKLIDNNVKVFKIRYLWFRIRRFISLIRNNVYRKNLVPNEFKTLL